MTPLVNEELGVISSSISDAVREHTTPTHIGGLCGLLGVGLPTSHWTMQATKDESLLTCGLTVGDCMRSFGINTGIRHGWLDVVLI